MLVNGHWTNKDNIIIDGAYIRPASVFQGNISQILIENVLSSLDTNPRYLLIISDSCPWSQRCYIARNLLNLENRIPVHITYGARVEGISLNDGNEWRLTEAMPPMKHLHQIYTHGHPDYTGRVTVPVLFDTLEQKILSNESAKIVEALNALATSVASEDMDNKNKLDLLPNNLTDDIHHLNQRIHTQLNNAVYRAGFAEDQTAYEDAMADVIHMMNHLNEILQERSFLFGDEITMSDIYLFPTLIRFDLVYYTLHRCSYKTLRDYPNLWAYSLRLYKHPKIHSTVNFDVIKKSSFLNDTTHNPSKIVPITNLDHWREAAN
ncbi:MAG: glutathione S-transferase C-terminal domain-containing protein [Alphaproteobacteria bacterium]|nr:glutathione S-transferase C-terminal domain-containing protein [Alphaproteobacteria bacterium]